MVKKLVLVIRDYSYLSWLKKSNDPALAWRQQKRMVIALLVGWYFSICTTLAIVSFKMKWHIFPQSANFLTKLMYGILMFSPYVAFMWWWLDTLDSIPVDETSSYRRRGFITWSVSIMGILIAVLIPPLLQEIMP